MSKREAIDEKDAPRIVKWLRERGGVLLWQSANLSNAGKTWKTPATGADGLVRKPSWEAEDEPAKHLRELSEFEVVEAVEVKRFHVSDGGSRRIREEIGLANFRTGKIAWYEFDYGATEFDPRGKNCIIYVEGEKTPLEQWEERRARATA